MSLNVNNIGASASEQIVLFILWMHVQEVKQLLWVEQKLKLKISD